MAARCRVAPFHVHTKLMASGPMVMIPTFISWFGGASRSRRSRFFCSQPKTGMSKYNEMFAQRMAMAGLKPHHRIAMAVSGGPDSIALCVLTAGWKVANTSKATYGRYKPIDGLLAIVVDHALRTESAEEANLVYNRISDMGIKCEVVRCEWLDGRPKAGHMQEAARNKRQSYSFSGYQEIVVFLGLQACHLFLKCSTSFHILVKDQKLMEFYW